MQPVKQVIVVRKDLNMRKGKLAAQVAHASMKFLIDNNVAEGPTTLLVELSADEAAWLLSGSFTKVVVGCDSEGELRDLVLKAELLGTSVCSIIDSGKTEFKGEPTLTCAAFGPARADEVDAITGHLRLL